MKLTLAQINALPDDEFVRRIGPVFEHSPWIAAAVAPRRPFATAAELQQALADSVRQAGVEKQLALIRAHPDLVGRLAQLGQLTPESTREQASAGLDQLTPAEVEIFHRHNATYHQKFGFPFVICARLNDKTAMLRGLETRLHQAREMEMQTALTEIFKIADLRLADLIQE
jgi:2-oxo-4-hydroxy-4-carboxy-5-ureidoimidazoline decarboxylase